jgi:hypothetical protein
MAYIFNPPFDEEASNCEMVGKPGFLISGARIDHYELFGKEIEKAIKDANPNLKREDYEFLAIFYRNEKDNKNRENLEGITKTAGGVILDEQHFYIVQPVKKIAK